MQRTSLQCFYLRMYLVLNNKTFLLIISTLQEGFFCFCCLNTLLRTPGSKAKLNEIYQYISFGFKIVVWGCVQSVKIVPSSYYGLGLTRCSVAFSICFSF